MSKDEVMMLDMEGCEVRALEIEKETEEASEDTLEALASELEAIEERKKTIQAEAEEKRAAMEAVLEGEGEVIEESKEERKLMDNKEIRKSPEYLAAWVEYQKGKANEEQRALLTENAEENGTIAVPAYVEDRIHTAWENDEIMRRIRRTFFKGNLKVGFELSSDGAKIHDEGGAAIEEEALVIGFVELIPSTIKKMVRYSTEVMDMKGQAWVDYIFDEIEYQIVKKGAEQAIAAMLASGLSSDVSPAGDSLTTADLIAAEGRLGGEAANPVVITTRATAAALKAAALSAQYGYDPFDGMEVLYVDAAALNGVPAIVADLSGVQANFPDGDQVKFVFDEYTEAPADIVRVIGRLMMGVDVVAPGKVVVLRTNI